MSNHRKSLQYKREQAAGYAPHGEVERVKRAVQQVYDGLYTVNFEKYDKSRGLRHYKVRLHSSTGPLVWATTQRGNADVMVYAWGDDPVYVSLKGNR